METDERRAQLLALGIELFAEKTYDEISVGEIAERAGISKGLLYHYFPSKRDFYVETVRAGCDAMLAAVETSPDLPHHERARAGLEAYLDFVEAHARAFVALLRSGIGVDTEVAEIVEATRLTTMRRLFDGLGLAEPSPSFRVMARAWVGAVEAAAVEWADKKDVPRAQLIDMLLETIAAMMTTAATHDGQS